MYLCHNNRFVCKIMGHPVCTKKKKWARHQDIKWNPLAVKHFYWRSRHSQGVYLRRLIPKMIIIPSFKSIALILIIGYLIATIGKQPATLDRSINTISETEEVNKNRLHRVKKKLHDLKGFYKGQSLMNLCFVF